MRGKREERLASGVGCMGHGIFACIYFSVNFSSNVTIVCMSMSIGNFFSEKNIFKYFFQRLLLDIVFTGMR